MTEFSINTHKKNDDLHIKLTGNFNEHSAYAIKSICNSQYKQGGRLFLDLRNLIDLKPNQELKFKKLLGELSLPAQKMFLKGEQAMNIGYNGSRILLMKSKKCACIKPCDVCSCKKRMAHRQSQQ